MWVLPNLLWVISDVLHIYFISHICEGRGRDNVCCQYSFWQYSIGRSFTSKVTLHWTKCVCIGCWPHLWGVIWLHWISLLLFLLFFFFLLTCWHNVYASLFIDFKLPQLHTDLVLVGKIMWKWFSSNLSLEGHNSSFPQCLKRARCSLLCLSGSHGLQLTSKWSKMPALVAGRSFLMCPVNEKRMLSITTSSFLLSSSTSLPRWLFMIPQP